MNGNNAVFLEAIEWLDESGTELIHRIPENGSGEIKFGAQLTVRESQAAVLFYKGRAYDAFGPGRHTLKTANLPILTKILSIPWAMTSPLRAEIYFANMKVFPNMKWGTRDPVAFKDDRLGLVRLRAFGIFNIHIAQPVLFINSITGTQGVFAKDEIEEYLNRVIVSRLNDYLGEHLDTLFNLPGKYDSIAEGLKHKLQDDFSKFGLALSDIYINSITPPLDVQKAIDDKSRLSIFDDLNSLLKMKAAMAFEKASDTKAEASAGIGLGMGMMIPAFFGSAAKAADMSGISCPECSSSVPAQSRFCPICGHQLLVFRKCKSCGADMQPDAKFCHICGKSADAVKAPIKCSRCGTENLPDALYCNQCGEKIG
ncbi:MAG: SPFH domain-containing protein [Nitrospirae bacterium]|nr:SPFH domain-containing protein [Nitrospirota bacterium]